MVPGDGNYTQSVVQSAGLRWVHDADCRDCQAVMVEQRGIEPLTSAVRLLRSPI